MKQYRGVTPIRTLSVMVLALFASLLGHPTTNIAEVISAEEWNISADKMTRYENPPSIIAEGNVILENEPLFIEVFIVFQGIWSQSFKTAFLPGMG